MNIVALTADNHQEVLSLACQTLEKGGLVVYPTETTYGIGADCENPEAIAKLLKYKSKRDGKPISVAVDSVKMAEHYVQLNQTARQVYANFLPGPVTVISKGRHLCAPLVESINGSLGIRISSHPITAQLIHQFGRGITATGANASYQKRPYQIQDILDNISHKQQELIDLVIDAGELPHNEPSTVIDTTLDDIQVSRFGPVDFSLKDSFISRDVAQTKEIARDLISRYRSKLTYAPLLIALTGEMGAGKTHFSQGIGAGLKITETITSPTYSLASEYTFTSEGRKGSFVHVDTWRMESEAELEALELSSFLSRNAVVVVEWADRFKGTIEKLSKSAQLIWVDLEILNQNERKITISHGLHTQSL